MSKIKNFIKRKKYGESYLIMERQWNNLTDKEKAFVDAYTTQVNVRTAMWNVNLCSSNTYKVIDKDSVVIGCWQKYYNYTGEGWTWEQMDRIILYLPYEDCKKLAELMGFYNFKCSKEIED